MEWMELIFEVGDAEGGGYCAKGVGTRHIFTEAETWEELRDNVREAAALHFEDSPEQPRLIQPTVYADSRGWAKGPKRC
jgi:predicted RNase H-like HicB family nuclease